MAAAPADCVSVHVIHEEPAGYPWWPANAALCGTFGGVAYYRPKPPPPPPPPRPPAIPAECVALALIHHAPADFPWWPGYALACGTFGGVAYFKPSPAWPPPPAPPPADEPPPDPDVTDPGAIEEFSLTPYGHDEFVNAVYSHSREYKLDPLAVFALGWYRGHDGTIGPAGNEYGPWWLRPGRQLPAAWAALKDPSAKANRWAWTDNGVRWAMSRMAHLGAYRKTGDDACHALVYGFEVRPKPAAEFKNVVYRYHALAVENAADERRDLIARFPGPPGAAGGPGPGPTTPPPPTSVAKAWDELTDAIGKALPTAGNAVAASGNRLRKVVK